MTVRSIRSELKDTHSKQRGTEKKAPGVLLEDLPQGFRAQAAVRGKGVQTETQVERMVERPGGAVRKREKCGSGRRRHVRGVGLD